MRPKDLPSSWKCGKCGTLHDDDDDSDDEASSDCWKCEQEKTKNISIADLHKEIKQLRDELKSVKEHNKSEIQRITDMLKETKMATQLRFSGVAKHIDDVSKSNKVDIERIEENGVRLNDDNIKTVKKIARKTVIKQIVKWESD